MRRLRKSTMRESQSGSKMYAVFLSRNADRQLKKYPRDIRDQIRGKIKALGKDAFPSDAKRIIGRKDKVFRIRSGVYRILYTVLENEVLVVHIDKREHAYQ